MWTTAKKWSVRAFFFHRKTIIINNLLYLLYKHQNIISLEFNFFFLYFAHWIPQSILISIGQEKNKNVFYRFDFFFLTDENQWICMENLISIVWFAESVVLYRFSCGCVCLSGIDMHCAAHASNTRHIHCIHIHIHMQYNMQ